jgi:hypothetical protein
VAEATLRISSCRRFSGVFFDLSFHRKWKIRKKQGWLKFTPDSLGSVTVDVKLTNAGKYRLQQ